MGPRENNFKVQVNWAHTGKFHHFKNFERVFKSTIAYRQTSQESNDSEISCPIGLLLLFPKVNSRRNGAKSPHHWRVQVHFHKQNIQCIKNDPIDDNMWQILEDIIKKWQKSLDQQGSEFIYELTSCLPDSDESVYGRSNEIAFVKDNVENEGVAVELIYIYI